MMVVGAGKNMQKKSTTGQTVKAEEGRGRIRSVIPHVLALVLVLSVVGALPLSSVAASGLSAGAACTPNFTVTATTNRMVTRGTSVLLEITITSVCGLTGNIGWSPSVTSPSHTAENGITLHQATYRPIVLTTTHTSGGASFSAVTTENTLMTTWTITVTAFDESNGSLRHSVNLSLTVDDFMISANPTVIMTSVGKTITSAVTATSQNGFSGQIFYSGLLSPSTVSPESCNLQPPQPTLVAGGSVISTLTCSFDAKGTYTMFETATPFDGAPSHNVTITFMVK
jgi:hypothetical protein